METYQSLRDRIFNTTRDDFNQLAVDVFQFQYANNKIYREFAKRMKINPSDVNTIGQIPFLPIQLFKTQKIITTDFEPQAVFESSGTTGTIPSKHYVRDLDLYKQSFMNCFKQFYGTPDKYCIIGLLPSYLERKNSSLVYMVGTLIKECHHPASGFYLHDFKQLHETIVSNENAGIKTILIGVTYALLDFSEQFPMQLQHTIIMETGGMKGRRAEISKQDLHESLKSRLSVSAIHSEYGMTELLSQAYATGDNKYNCPNWMRILVRSEDDPLFTNAEFSEIDFFYGPINVIDLANLFSCSFIATEDYGKVYSNGSFEVQGRIADSHARGCSLMWP